MIGFVTFIGYTVYANNTIRKRKMEQRYTAGMFLYLIRSKLL